MPTRVNIYEEEINKLLDDRGNDAYWEEAVVCNCYNPDNGQPSFTCPYCHGEGFRYLEPKLIRIGVTSLTSNYTLDSLMLREPGTAYVTPMSDVIMGYHDRLTFKDFKCKFSEIIHPGNATHRKITKVLYVADELYEYEEGIDFTVTEDSHHLEFKSSSVGSVSILYLTTPRYYVQDLLHELRASISDRFTPVETFRELPKQYLVKREMWTYGINV